MLQTLKAVMMVGEESCRFCLTTNASVSYYLLDDFHHLDLLSQTCNLTTALQDPAVHPKHICDQCSLVINRFAKLRGVAQKNDDFVRNWQYHILNFGVREALAASKNISGDIKADNKNTSAWHHIDIVEASKYVSSQPNQNYINPKDLHDVEMECSDVSLIDNIRDEKDVGKNISADIKADNNKLGLSCVKL